MALQSWVCLSRESRCPGGSGRSSVGHVETQCRSENMDGKVSRHTAMARETGMHAVGHWATCRFAHSGMRVAVRTVPHSTQRQWGCPKGLARKKIWRYLSSVLNTQLVVVVAWYLRLLISEPPSCLVGRTELHTIVNSWDGIGTGFHNRILCMVLRTLC